MNPITIPDNLTVLAHRHIKKYILEGHLDHGERITEEAISLQLGISKTPVREALQRLEVEGLICIERRRGAQLRKLSEKDIFNLYDYREAIEAHGVLTAKATPGLFEDLNRSIVEMKKQRDEGEKIGYIHRDVEFHSRLIEATDNARLMDAFANLQDQLHLLRVNTHDVVSRHGVQAHTRLVELLQSGDRLGAVALMREHIRATRDALVAHLAEVDAERLTSTAKSHLAIIKHG